MKRKIFFPGSFSPFHDGHYSMIKQLLKFDNKPISFMSSHNKQLISATMLREDIQNKNWKEFKSGYKIMMQDKIISEYKLKKFYKKLMEV